VFESYLQGKKETRVKIFIIIIIIIIRAKTTCNHADYNFDHPDAFDLPAIQACLDCLKKGQATEIPMYDFLHHCRTGQMQQVQPAEVILFEGILVLHITEIVERLNMKVRGHVWSSTATHTPLQNWFQSFGPTLHWSL
jgi:hypothetical protein